MEQELLQDLNKADYISNKIYDFHRFLNEQVYFIFRNMYRARHARNIARHLNLV
jgi:hypothetical protein